MICIVENRDLILLKFTVSCFGELEAGVMSDVMHYEGIAFQ